MPIEGEIQPEKIQVDEKIRLRKYNGNIDFAMEWYQDIELVYLVDGVKEPYSYDKLERMYDYLNCYGELYFIEVLENDKYIPIGDVTFCKDDMSIVIGDSKYHGKHIGRKVISVLVKRGKLLDALEICKKYNISVNIDTFSEPDLCDKYPLGISENSINYNDINIVSMHAPYKDLCLGSKDKLIKSVTMARFEYAYIIAKILKCKNIIIHHGYIPGTSVPDYWVERATLFFKEFLYNKDDDILIHIENQFEHTPDIMMKVLSEVNDNRLGICLDVGHANCNSKMSVIEWIKKLDLIIVAVLISATIFLCS